MKSAPGFISDHLRFKGRIATVSIAVSFFVMIVSVAISTGFRREIRNGLSDLTGDVQMTGEQLNYFSESSPIPSSPSYMGKIMDIEGVTGVSPAVYRAGIVKSGETIQGVIFKGIPRDDSLSMTVSIPRRLASITGLKEGDGMTAYFVSEKVKARKFTVRAIHDSIIESDDNLIVSASLQDIQRLNGWSEQQVSSLEIKVLDRFRNPAGLRRIASEAGSIALVFATEDDPVLVATSSAQKYPQMFDWLQLIDTNVLAILILMTIVAGFNMISGLLILLFRHISTIGTLKALGMSDKDISKVFLKVSSRAVLMGMAAGNAAALLFCLVQGTTHVIGLNPENYFVSFVPVGINPLTIIAADILSYLVILLFLLIPSRFISKVDPARTIKAR